MPYTPNSIRRARAAFALTALTLAAACGSQNNARPDDALKSDLSLTNRPPGQQTVAPQELTPGQTAPAGYAPGAVGPNGAPVVAAAPVAPAPAVAPRTDTVVRTVYRDRPARHHHSSSSSSGTYSSGSASGGTVAERPTVRTSHTKEGAAIGGAAGALIGAATGGGVKGAIIGGILGGGAGAVIGNNPGVKHVPQY